MPSRSRRRRKRMRPPDGRRRVRSGQWEIAAPLEISAPLGEIDPQGEIDPLGDVGPKGEIAPQGGVTRQCGVAGRCGIAGQCNVERIRSISSLICSFSIFSLAIVSGSGCGRWSSSKIRDSSEAWRSFRASSRAYRLMGDISPIIASCFAAIHTTNAVSITASNASAAGDVPASEFRFNDYGSRRFFRGKAQPC
jgi:hypothetical protein